MLVVGTVESDFMEKPCCHIQLFGGLRVFAEGDRLIADEVGSGPASRLPHRVSALLAFLALHLGVPQPRDVAAEHLWPERTSAQTRNSLSTTLSLLRRHLQELDELTGTPDGIFITSRDQIGLNAAFVTTDVAKFESLLEAADQSVNSKGAATPRVRALLLEQAVTLYLGDLMPGFYDDWLIREQERLRSRYAEALRSLARTWQQAGDLEVAARTAQQAVDVEPLQEETHHLLIESLADSGRVAAALTAYARLEALLEKELGIAPPEATRKLAEKLRSGPIPKEPQLVIPAPPPRAETAQPPAMHEPIDWREPVGGAVPLGSPFYVARPVDTRFYQAVRRQDSIVLVKGARQVGKTSLLARGLQEARNSRSRVALTDFEAIGNAAFDSADSLYRTLAQGLADQLTLDVDPAAHWNTARSSAMNLERFLTREVLKAGAESSSLVWGLDEIDRLFTCAIGSEVFALFRSWHNRRSLDPAGPWGKLTLAIAYATEVHLFITDLNQSPFNVGTRLILEDFDREQVGGLNQKYGSPLSNDLELDRFRVLVGGHPYLVRRGFAEMARVESEQTGAAATLLTALETRPLAEESLYGDHLQRLRHGVEQDGELTEVVRGLLRGEPCPTLDTLYRLWNAGVLIGDTLADARFRCGLYRNYLGRHLTGQT